MRLSELSAHDEPASALFDRALEIVFDDGDPNAEHLDRLTIEARLAYLVWSFDGEIHNGGFDQLFVNSLGNHCAELVEYLDEIGAVISAGLLRSALSYFPNGVAPMVREERWRVWEPISEQDVVEEALERLDQKFYEYEDGINELLGKYMEKHPGAKLKA